MNTNGPQVVLPPVPEHGLPPSQPGMAGMMPAPPRPMPGFPMQQGQGQPPPMPYQIGQFGLPPRTPNGPPMGIPPFPGAR